LILGSGLWSRFVFAIAKLDSFSATNNNKGYAKGRR
jgi:hypothetical protein